MKLQMRIPDFPMKETLIRAGSTALLKGRKHAPTILVAAGVAGAVGATVLACKSTLSVHDILVKHEEQINLIKNTADNKEEYPEYTEEMVAKDKFIVYIQTGVSLLKLYAPSIILGGLSITAIVGSHYIMTKRNAALSATCAALSKAFAEYRKRVAEEIGEDREKDIFAGYREKVIEEEVTTKKGSKLVKKTQSEYDEHYSIYARLFGPGNEWYRGGNANIKGFLWSQQCQANELLRIHGYLFLSDVYRMLGFKETPESRVVGWIYGHGDSTVLFGIDDRRNAAFINGEEESIWLDFNVDGVIYDMI